MASESLGDLCNIFFPCIYRSQFTGGNREWIMAAGQKWTRKSVFTDY